MGRATSKQRAILITHVAVRNHPVTTRHIESVTADVEVVERVELRPPLRDELDEFDEHYPWDDAMAMQAQTHAQLRACVEAHPEARVIYMGYVPIPLAFHFGRLLGDHTPIEIFQHHKQTKSWLWPSEEPTPGLLEPLSLAPADSASTRDVLLRVSSSYPISSQDTAWNMRECGLGLSQPHPNGIRSPADLRSFAAKFRDLVDAARQRFPSAPVRHLAASVPVGAALAMGMELNPTIHLPIQTWKYLGNRRPRYVKAALLSDFVDLPKVLLLAASPVDQAAISTALEIQQLGELLAQHDRRLDLVSRHAAGVDTLTLSLAKLDPTILHIACHGELLARGGLLRLVAADGWSATVDTEDLSRLLKRAPSLRCVVFAACDSAGLAREISGQVPCAIGWKGELHDTEARVFSNALWRSLVAGHSIQEAFLDARLHIVGDRDQVVLEVADGVDANTLIPFPGA